MPLLKAAAVVAFMLSLGVAQHTFSPMKLWIIITILAAGDTYDDPAEVYKQVSSALMMLSEGINKSQDQNLADSVRLGGVDMINE